MYCTKCGKRNPDGKNYCTFCGAPLKKTEAVKPQNPQNEQKKKTKKKPWKTVAALAAVAIAGVLCFVLFNNGDNEAEDLNAYIDAEKYYEENSDIISTINAKKSEEVQTESEVSDFCRDRDFSMYPITYECSIEGEYQPAEEVSDSSKEKHPIYQTYYISSKKEMWTIDVINGNITAYPVMYNQDNGGVQTIVAEKDTVVSYDIATNTYFENRPDKDAVNLIVVDRIDAETLEGIQL